MDTLKHLEYLAQNEISNEVHIGVDLNFMICKLIFHIQYYGTLFHVS